MEEAIADLHNAIHLALSLNPQDFSGGDDLLQNGVINGFQGPLNRIRDPFFNRRDSAFRTMRQCRLR